MTCPEGRVFGVCRGKVFYLTLYVVYWVSDLVSGQDVLPSCGVRLRIGSLTYVGRSLNCSEGRVFGVFRGNF